KLVGVGGQPVAGAGGVVEHHRVVLLDLVLTVVGFGPSAGRAGDAEEGGVVGVVVVADDVVGQECLTTAGADDGSGLKDGRGDTQFAGAFAFAGEPVVAGAVGGFAEDFGVAPHLQFGADPADLDLVVRRRLVGKGAGRV